MQLLPWLPKFLHRHKVLDFICRFGLQESVLPIQYNSTARTVIDLRDPEPRNVFISKEFEPEFFDLATSFLGENGTVFDLGCNVGFCSFGLIPNHKQTVFHLFEANPNLIPLLKQSIGLHPDQIFHLNHCCISDTHGKTNFQLEVSQSGQSHVCPPKGKGIELPNLVLDDYCDLEQVNCIDFAKMDLEGHELPSLQGWGKSLSAHRINALYIEIIPENQARYGRETNAPLFFLESLGYSLYLCKVSDFGRFGDHPKRIPVKKGSLLLAKFNASEYPEKFSTDILAIGSN
jgi:FkbM family methyltransferase